MLDYYAEHSKITKFGVYRELIDELPDSPEELMRIVQGLLIHQVDGVLFKFKISRDRCQEIELRSVESMTRAILELSNQPLFEPRTPEKRLVSSCRDFAVFYCALLREKDVPARVRTGFVNYLFTGGKQDHLLTEYWSKDLEKWLLTDSRMTPIYQKKVKQAAHLDPYDISINDFSIAGRVWLSCQAGKADPDTYATGLNKDFRGLRYIQDKVIQDLACLNKMEMLPWDCWGYMVEDLPGIAPHSPEHIALIDEVSEKTAHIVEYEIIKKLYQHPKLKVPEQILSVSKTLGTQQVNVGEFINE